MLCKQYIVIELKGSFEVFSPNENEIIMEIKINFCKNIDYKNLKTFTLLSPNTLRKNIFSFKEWDPQISDNLENKSNIVTQKEVKKEFNSQLKKSNTMSNVFQKKQTNINLKKIIETELSRQKEEEKKEEQTKKSIISLYHTPKLNPIQKSTFFHLKSNLYSISEIPSKLESSLINKFNNILIKRPIQTTAKHQKRLTSIIPYHNHIIE